MIEEKEGRREQEGRRKMDQLKISKTNPFEL